MNKIWVMKALNYDVPNPKICIKCQEFNKTNTKLGNIVMNNNKV